MRCKYILLFTLAPIFGVCVLSFSAFLAEFGGHRGRRRKHVGHAHLQSRKPACARSSPNCRLKVRLRPSRSVRLLQFNTCNLYLQANLLCITH
jgi:hypothetical protein